MIFQATLGNTGNSANGTTFNVPFVGRCRVKIIKIDYFVSGFPTSLLLRLESRTIINNTPISPYIYFMSLHHPTFVDFIYEDIEINGMIDFSVKTETGGIIGGGNYTDCLITLDIEYMDKIKM